MSARLAIFCAGATASSRSNTTASAPLDQQRSIFLGESPGTNSHDRDRFMTSGRLAPHQRRTPGAHHDVAGLVDAAMLELHDAERRPRPARQDVYHLGFLVNRVALKDAHRKVY